ncbi:RNA 2',3'-cyclic phosphodiesterase [Nesterenkonia sp.]|uniref:RNA 2',3'-cyclic phosphodiesterase n=1 Tax=Nesterenkonia sp. TaxID=704201 RepID=UPI00260841C4|nr:RNA 2',3'-cyclic phosphodiesterase [Nesterenkonia sp.]
MGRVLVSGMRLFVGFFLPEHVRTHLGMAVDSVHDGVSSPAAGHSRPALRWVQPEDRHITLAFYGEVPAGAVDDLTEHLHETLCGVPPLTLRLRGTGVFAGRTLWAGVQEQSAAEHSNGSNPLIDLMRAVEEVGVHYARSPETPTVRERRRAHVTLARARDRRKGEAEIRRLTEALAIYEGPEFCADTVHLVHSELGGGKSGAPLYASLAALPLAGSSEPE